MSDVEHALARARDAIVKNDWQVALGHLLETWRTRRVARIGTLIDLVSKRIPASPIAAKSVKARIERWLEVANRRDSADIGSLLATTWPGKWQDGLTILSALAALPDDPRIAIAIANFLGEVPWEAAAARAFYEAALALLTRLGDRRVVPIVESSLRREKTAAWEKFRPLFVQAVESMAAPEPLLAPSEVAALDSVEALFAGDTKANKAEDELLQAIYASPDDDGPRIVYADWLGERGDPRGEFIALQLARNPEPHVRLREAALLKKYGAAWAGALDGVMYGDYREFRRGFLTSGIVRDRDGIRDELRHPAWALVESLSFVWFKAEATTEALLAAPFLKTLRAISGLPEAVVARMAKEGLAPNLEEFRLALAKDATPSIEARRQLATGFPKLKSVGLGGDLPDILEYLAGPLPKIERLIVVHHPPPLAEIAKAVVEAKLEIEEIEARERLDGDDRGFFRFALQRNARGDFTRLHARVADPSMRLPMAHSLVSVIHSLPGLEELVVDAGSGHGWERSSLAALETTLAASRKLRRIEVPWDRGVAPFVARGARASVTFGTIRDEVVPRLDEIWSALEKHPAALSFDAFDLGGGHTPLEASGLEALKSAFTQKRTAWVELYRRASSDTMCANFRRNLMTITSPRGDDFHLDGWLAWVVATLDEVGFDSVSARWQEWSGAGELLNTYPRKVGALAKEIGWLTAFGPGDETVYSLGKLAAAGRSFPNTRVLRTKRLVLFVFGDAPDRALRAEEVDAFETNVVAPARHSS